MEHTIITEHHVKKGMEDVDCPFTKITKQETREIWFEASDKGVELKLVRGGRNIFAKFFPP